MVDFMKSRRDPLLFARDAADNPYLRRAKRKGCIIS